MSVRNDESLFWWNSVLKNPVMWNSKDYKEDRATTDSEPVSYIFLYIKTLLFLYDIVLVNISIKFIFSTNKNPLLKLHN